MRKFAQRWFGPYVVVTIHDNATYSLRELDGTQLRIPIIGKQIKVFKRMDDKFALETFDEILLQQNNRDKSNLEIESEEYYDHKNIEE